MQNFKSLASSEAEQAGLNLNWSQTLEDTFSLDRAQMKLLESFNTPIYIVQIYTVNFLNIRTLKRFVVITLKFELCGSIIV